MLFISQDTVCAPNSCTAAPNPSTSLSNPFSWRMLTRVCLALQLKFKPANQVSCVFVARGAGGPGRIVTGGYDNIAKVWNLETLKEEQSLGGHTKAVTACFAGMIAAIPKGKNISVTDSNPN